MKDINLVLENIVYMELLRRGYTVTVGKAGDKEIDFVCEDQGEQAIYPGGLPAGLGRYYPAGVWRL